LDEIPLSVLFGTLFFLIIFSAFFSSSETAMIALNRYRLRHLAKEGKRSAIISEKLLERPDRLIGLILLGNNLVNFFAASIATVIGIRLLGDIGIALAPIILVLVFLIFAEVMPKTIAAINPEKIALPASYVLNILMKLAYPAVWLINAVSNNLLSVIGINIKNRNNENISSEELRTIVREAGILIPQRHQRMLINILDLENVTVNDIMVPRNEVTAIDLDKPIDDIVEQFVHCQHTRLPVYRSNIENIIGVIHIRRIPRIMNDKEITKDSLTSIMEDCYFVPSGTPLHVQMLNFQRKKRRFGIVVDEYGVIQGVVTLEDILEEIVGEYNQDNKEKISIKINESSYIFEGSVQIREINKSLGWKIPEDTAKTINGYILECLEDIPSEGVSFWEKDYFFEIIKITNNFVKNVKVTKK
jgi:Mg2+/Co2+ transporter CorB